MLRCCRRGDLVELSRSRRGSGKGEEMVGAGVDWFDIDNKGRELCM